MNRRKSALNANGRKISKVTTKHETISRRTAMNSANTPPGAMAGGVQHDYRLAVKISV